MLSLTYTLVKPLLNTGNELTAQSLRLNLTELYFGVAGTCYMAAADAQRYLKPEHYQPGRNPLYLHLNEAGLKAILRKGNFVLTDE